MSSRFMEKTSLLALILVLLLIPPSFLSDLVAPLFAYLPNYQTLKDLGTMKQLGLDISFFLIVWFTANVDCEAELSPTGGGQRDGDRERICCIYFYWIDNDDITLAQNPVAAGVEFWRG